MPKCIYSGPVFFCDTLRQVATVVTETAQMVLSQFENFLTQSIENWIRSIYPYQKWSVNVVNWWKWNVMSY